MPNTPVRAAAEGLPEINRRSLLAGIVLAPVVAAPAEAAPKLTPEERIDAALQQIGQALLELDPTTGSRICYLTDSNGRIDTLMVVANHPHLMPGQVEYVRNQIRKGGAA